MDLAQLKDDFALLESWEDRYKYLIELGRDHAGLPEALRRPEHKVTGCLSQVWLVPRVEPGPRISFQADSDAHIVRGLIAVLRLALSGRTPAEIAASDLEALFRDLGLDRHLSPNRRNGFFAMVNRVKALAREAAAAA